MASNYQNSNSGSGSTGQENMSGSALDQVLAIMDQSPMPPLNMENNTMSLPYFNQQNINQQNFNQFQDFNQQNFNEFQDFNQQNFNEFQDPSLNRFQNDLSGQTYAWGMDNNINQPFPPIGAQDIPNQGINTQYPSPEGIIYNNNFQIPQQQAAGSVPQAIPNNMNDSGIVFNATPVLSQPIPTPGATSPAITAIDNDSVAATTSSSPSVTSSPIAAPVQSTGRGKGDRKRKATTEPEPESGGEGQNHRQKRRQKCKMYSCTRCRKAKVKCDGEHGKPCSRCVKTGKECIIDNMDRRTKNTNFGDFLNKLEKKKNLILECYFLGLRVTSDPEVFRRFQQYWNQSRNASTTLEMFSAFNAEWQDTMKQRMTEYSRGIMKIMEEARAISFENVKVKDIRPLKNKLKKVANWTLAWLYCQLDTLWMMKPDHQDVNQQVWGLLVTNIDKEIESMHIDDGDSNVRCKNAVRARGKVDPTYLRRTFGEWEFKEECLQNAKMNNRSLSPAAVPQAQQAMAPQPQVSLPQGQQLIPKAQADTIDVNPEAQAPALPQEWPYVDEIMWEGDMLSSPLEQPQQNTNHPALLQPAIDPALFQAPTVEEQIRQHIEPLVYDSIEESSPDVGKCHTAKDDRYMEEFDKWLSEERPEEGPEKGPEETEALEAELMAEYQQVSVEEEEEGSAVDLLFEGDLSEVDLLFEGDLSEEEESEESESESEESEISEAE